MVNKSEDVIFSKNTSRSKKNEYGDVSIRIEDLLAGKDLNELTQVADISAHEKFLTYLERIKTLNEKIDECRNGTASVDYFKKYDSYFFLLQLSSKDANEFTSEEKLVILDEYKKIFEMCGPSEYTDKLTLEENFSARDVLGDKSIFCVVLDRVKKYLEIAGSEVPEDVKALAKRDLLIKKAIKLFNLSGLSFADFDMDKNEIESLLDGNTLKWFYEKDVPTPELDERKRYSFSINKDIFFQRFEEICEVLNYIHSTGIDIDLVIDENGKKPEGYNFNTRVPYSLKLDELAAVDNIANCGIVKNMYFSEFYEERNVPRDRDDMWTAKEVIDANKNIYDYANEIKSLNLSPFEKLLLMQMRIAKTDYTGRKDNDEKTSTFLTAFKTENQQTKQDMESEGKAYVCTGYACLAKAMIDAIGDNGLKSFVTPISFYYRSDGQRKYGAKHSVDVVHLVDKKYGIDGYYVYDPTWSMSWSSLDLSLVPIGDTQKFKDRYAIFDESKSSRAEKYLVNLREENFDEVQNKNFVYDRYKGKSKPVEVEKFWDALIFLHKKVQNSGYKTNYKDMQGLSPEEFANSKINESVKNLPYFYSATAEDDFYRLLREYMKSHEDKYPNWEENWETYVNQTGYDYATQRNL